MKLQMIKGSIQEEDVTIINIYAPNIGAPQYVRQMLTSMKGEINSSTIRMGDVNTPLTPMDRSPKEKISKETQTLNHTIDQLDLIDIYRTSQLSHSVVSDLCNPMNCSTPGLHVHHQTPGVHSDSRPSSP